MSQETSPNMISLHGIVIVNVESKMNQALKIMQDSCADPHMLERWKDVVNSYMKRVPDGMTPAAHMASAIVAADLFIASIDDRIPHKKTARVPNASPSATDESFAIDQGTNTTAGDTAEKIESLVRNARRDLLLAGQVRHALEVYRAKLLRGERPEVTVEVSAALALEGLSHVDSGLFSDETTVATNQSS